MRLPRDVGADDLIAGLGRLGYCVTRQSGSHVRLTRRSDDGEQHLTIPRHRPLRVGTLGSIIALAATQLGLDKQELVARLF